MYIKQKGTDTIIVENGEPVQVDNLNGYDNNLFEPIGELPEKYSCLNYQLRKVEEIAMWRIRAIVNVMGLTDRVNTLLNCLNEPEKSIALTAWNYGNTVERNSNTVAFLQQGLQLTDEQVNNIFNQAADIKI